MSITAGLRAAQSGGNLVRVLRREGWDRREGYVVGVGSKWVLLAVIDDRIRPDGFSAIRLRDITKVKHSTGIERFVRRALEIDGTWPLRGPVGAVGLDRSRDLVASLADLFPLISVFEEVQNPDGCCIGQPVRYDEACFYLREVTRNAEWRGPTRSDWSRWKFRELTRVDAGGGYESALAKVAGDPAE